MRTTDRPVRMRIKRVLFRLLAVVLALALALVISEVVVRVVKPQNLSGTWRVYSRRGYKLNKAGGSVRHQFGKRLVRYRFNEFHLRGAPVGSGRHRILVLGDSFTFGWLVREEDTFVALWQAYANDEFAEDEFDFLNGGAGGWGTADGLAYLEEFGEDVNPSVVVVMVNAADIGRSLERGLYTLEDSAPLRLKAHHDSRKPSRLKIVVNALPFYQWLLEHSHLVQLARRTWMRSEIRKERARVVGPEGREIPVPASGLSVVDEEEVLTFSRALFRRINRWCCDHDARLLVCTTGWHLHEAFDPPVSVAGPTSVFMEHAEDILGEEGIPFRDITGDVVRATHGDPLPFAIPHEGHPNEEGHAMMARLLWPWLREQLGPLARGRAPTG